MNEMVTRRHLSYELSGGTPEGPAVSKRDGLVYRYVSCADQHYELEGAIGLIISSHAVRCA